MTTFTPAQVIIANTFLCVRGKSGQRRASCHVDKWDHAMAWDR